MSLEVTYAIRELRPGDTEVREIVANSCCQHLVSGKLRLVVNAFGIVLLRRCHCCPEKDSLKSPIKYVGCFFGTGGCTEIEFHCYIPLDLDQLEVAIIFVFSWNPQPDHVFLIPQE